MDGLADLLGSLGGRTPTGAERAQRERVHRAEHAYADQVHETTTGPFGVVYHTCKPFDRSVLWPGDCPPCLQAVADLVSPPQRCEHRLGLGEGDDDG